MVQSECRERVQPAGDSLAPLRWKPQDYRDPAGLGAVRYYHCYPTESGRWKVKIKRHRRDGGGCVRAGTTFPTQREAAKWVQRWYAAAYGADWPRYAGRRHPGLAARKPPPPPKPPREVRDTPGAVFRLLPGDGWVVEYYPLGERVGLDGYRAFPSLPAARKALRRHLRAAWPMWEHVRADAPDPRRGWRPDPGLKARRKVPGRDWFLGLPPARGGVPLWPS